MFRATLDAAYGVVKLDKESSAQLWHAYKKDKTNARCQFIVSINEISNRRRGHPRQQRGFKMLKKQAFAASLKAAHDLQMWLHLPLPKKVLRWDTVFLVTSSVNYPSPDSHPLYVQTNSLGISFVSSSESVDLCLRLTIPESYSTRSRLYSSHQAH